MGKRLLALLSVLVVAFAFVACGIEDITGGGKGGPEYLGVYHSVCGEMYDMTLTGDDVERYTIELSKNGKGTLTADDKTAKFKYTLEGTDITISVGDNYDDMTGTLENDLIVIDDVLGMGIKLTFAKEGTDAELPENFLPEKEREMLGYWIGTSVTDFSGNDISENIDPATFSIEIDSDHSALATLGDYDIWVDDWALFDGTVYDEEITWRIEGDELVAEYMVEDENYIFRCEKED